MVTRGQGRGHPPTPADRGVGLDSDAGETGCPMFRNPAPPRSIGLGR